MILMLTLTSFFFISTFSNPMPIIMLIIMSTIMGSYEMVLNSNMSWIPLITIMLFVGGLMITYIFILSMNSNEKLHQKVTLPYIIIIVSLMFMVKTNKKKSNKETGSMFFSNSWMSMYMILSFIIITMIFMTNMIFNPSSPSKSMK